MKKKLISTMLALCLCLNLFPATARAAEPNSTPEPSGEAVVQTDDPAQMTEGNGNYKYEDNIDGTITIMKFTGSDTDVEIPATIDGKKVTVIFGEAFDGCKSLTSVKIPDGVKTIDAYAFYNCTSLERVTIPDSVETIGRGAFADCSELTSVTIPDKVTTIDEQAFHGCSKLASVTIPSSVTTIGTMAFCDCRSLTSVTIPSSVTTIGVMAFENCNNIKTVYYVGNESSWGNISIDSTNKISDDKVVYCRAVTLDLNGGTGDTSGLISRKDAKVLAAAPTRSGYTFAGWYTAKDGGEEVNMNNHSSCTTVYARWRKNIGGSDVSSDITITCESSTLIYNAKAQSPTVTVKDGEKTLVLDTDYTLSGDTTGTNAQTYTLTITGQGNYIGTVTKDWSIASKQVTADVTVDENADLIYTSSPITPTVMVKDGSDTIDSNEYTVEYSNNTNAGDATVTIVDSPGGNYDVSGGTTFTIKRQR